MCRSLRNVMSPSPTRFYFCRQFFQDFRPNELFPYLSANDIRLVLLHAYSYMYYKNFIIILVSCCELFCRVTAAPRSATVSSSTAVSSGKSAPLYHGGVRACTWTTEAVISCRECLHSRVSGPVDGVPVAKPRGGIASIVQSLSIHRVARFA